MKNTSKIVRAPWRLGKHSGFILLLSFGINLLGLVGAIYMMQVYDRVLSSGSVPTLVSISIIALVLYLFLGCLDYLRATFLKVYSENFADKHAPKAFQVALDAHAREPHDSEKRYAIEDLKTIRSFVGSKGYSSIYDVLWTPVFLFFIFSLHFILGVTALVATVCLIGLAAIKERVSRKRVEDETTRVMASRQELSNIHNHAQLIIANGMDGNMGRRWLTAEKDSRVGSLNFATLSEKYSVSTKTIRMIIQSMILGLGGYLAITGHISPGAMIAASIVFTRTLAPVERLLSNFSLLTRARQSWQRAEAWISDAAQGDKIALPTPSESLHAEILYLIPPGGKTPVLKGVNFKLQAGDVLGILGPSGSGKSSLAKALSGAWSVQSGSVAMDQADYKDWRKDQLGAAIGYMPQESQFFDGTISENISGFQDNVNEDAVLKAGMTACAHEMILGLPQGYNTLIGPSGLSLSAGQRQRLSLARAIFGDPFIVVLDEPNSNLDDDGEKALLDAIKSLKDKNKIVIIVAHRKRILKYSTKLCLILEGKMSLFGPAKTIAKKIMDAGKKKLPRVQNVKSARPSQNTPSQTFNSAPDPSPLSAEIYTPLVQQAPHNKTPMPAVPDQSVAMQTPINPLLAPQFNVPPNPYLHALGIKKNA